VSQNNSRHRCRIWTDGPKRRCEFYWFFYSVISKPARLALRVRGIDFDTIDVMIVAEREQPAVGCFPTY
jgi:hypothetical protein